MTGLEEFSISGNISQDIVNRIIHKIKKDLREKKDIIYAYIVDYILGHGNWSDLQGKKALIRVNIIESSNDQELNQIIEWCSQNIRNKKYIF